MNACPAIANSEIVHRPDVGPPQLEEQEHLGGPPADSAHRHQARDDLVVAEVVQVVRGDGPVDELRGEVDDRGEDVAEV